jgi:hypothetical protein
MIAKQQLSIINLLLLGLRRAPMPALEVIFVGVDLFPFDCFSNLVHILYLSPDVYFSFLFDFCHHVSPGMGDLPELSDCFLTLIFRPLLAVMIMFLSLIYIVFERFIS